VNVLYTLNDDDYDDYDDDDYELSNFMNKLR
jgi:hypothetical protein